MPKLTDTEALKKAVRDDPNIDGLTYARIMRHIIEAKREDAVPVVKCKECKHYVWNEFDGAYVCLSIGRFVKPDFWCADGERRTNG